MRVKERDDENKTIPIVRALLRMKKGMLTDMRVVRRSAHTRRRVVRPLSCTIQDEGLCVHSAASLRAVIWIEESHK
jgi:hypothetical protein